MWEFIVGTFICVGFFAVCMTAICMTMYVISSAWHAGKGGR